MTLSDCVLSAFTSLRAYKVRSLLSAAAVGAGAAAVIAMLAIGSGATEKVLAQIRSMGSNTFVIWAGWIAHSGVTSSGYVSPHLTDLDAAAIQTLVDGVEIAAPLVARDAHVVAPGANWKTVLNGVDPGFFQIREWGIADGRTFDTGEIRNGAQVAILGATVARKLFERERPLNQTIRIGQAPFKVIGVMEARGQSLIGQDQDDLVFVPLTSARQRILGVNRVNANSVNLIFVQVSDAERIFEIEQAVEQLLRDRHRIPPDQKSDFGIRHLADVYGVHATSVRTASLLLAIIAGVALIGGGCGIANVMLASVTERRPEIGLRIAVGARKRDIALQFLTEAAAIAISGALPGIAVGTLGALILGAAFDWPLSMPLHLVGFVIAACIAVGLAAGLIPALRAARLDPIQALQA
jgi:putative ABC transport system permease protein